MKGHHERKNRRSCLEIYKLHKNPSLHFKQHWTKYITLHLFLYATFSLKQNLVFKFYLVLIGILDNFRPNLFTCLPFDYQLLFHWSWSLSSASIHFLIRTSIRTTKILRVQSCKLYNNKYIIASTEITNTEDFTFIAFLVFKLLSRKVLFINRKDNSNY